MTQLSDTISTFTLPTEQQDRGTSTPTRPWIGSKVAPLALAAAMLTAPASSIRAEASTSSTPQVRTVGDPAHRNETGFTVVRESDITTMNDATKQSNLRALFEFRDVSAVSSFLRDNPFLSTVLLGTYYAVADHFGKRTPLALEVFSDPEEVGRDHLRLLIQTYLPVDEALDRLIYLHEKWFYNVRSITQDKLLIDIEP